MKTKSIVTALAALVLIAATVGASYGASSTKSAPVQKASTTTTSHTKSSSSSSHAKSSQKSETTYTAEVVDLPSYVLHSGAAASQTEPAMGTAASVGLLIKGSIYIPVMKDRSMSAGALSEYIGKNVEVTGMKEEVGGNHFLVVKSFTAPKGTK